MPTLADVTRIELPFSGRCAACRQEVPQGSEALHVAGKGLHHPACVDPELGGTATDPLQPLLTVEAPVVPTLTPADVAYLKELAHRLHGVPTQYGMGPADYDRLLAIAEGN